MTWIVFLLSSAAVVAAAVKLAEYGDIIAVRTRLGGLFIGTLLLATATSLPEILSTLTAFQLASPNLAAGNLLGSNMANMALLAVVDLASPYQPLLRRAAIDHALTASLATLMSCLVAVFIFVNWHFAVGWVGSDSLAIIAIYAVGIFLIRSQGQPMSAPSADVDARVMSLRAASIRFAAAAGALMIATPILVTASKGIAQETGLGAGFVGAALLAMVTSLPELVSALAAVRLGALDLAVGNLFGSNILNLFVLGIADLVYFPGPILGAIDPDFALVALLGLLLTNIALVGNLVRVNWRPTWLTIDAVLILVVYLGGMYLLYLRGIGI
jgi:cation:H+ antiporter